MANQESLAQRYMNDIMQRMYQEQQRQANITGAGGSGSTFLDAFQAAFNAGNGIVNAARTNQENARLRDWQKKQDSFDPTNPTGNNTGNVYGSQIQPQQALMNQSASNYPSWFSKWLGQGAEAGGGDYTPFGISANDEGQRIAEQGSISPSLSEHNITPQGTTSQNVTPQTATPQVAQQPQQQPQLSDYDARINALPTAKYLDGRLSMDKYLEYAKSQGMGNTQAMMNYFAFAQPLEQEARRARMEENFKIFNDPNASAEMKQRAVAGLSFDLNNLTLADDIQHKKDAAQMARDKLLIDAGFMPRWMEPYAGGGTEGGENTAGNSVLNVLNGFKEGEQWMSPDGTGDSDTQCSNFVSHGLRKAGIDIKGSANGDELMKQFGERNAYHKGTLEGIQPGDVIDFPKHVAFYIGNGMYKARNSKGGVHTGTMEEAVSAFGQPIGYASVREYTAGGGNRWGALRMTPKAMRQAAKDQAEMDYKRALLGLRAEDNAIKRERIAARYGVNSTGNRQLSQKELEKLNKAKETMADAGYSLSQTEGKFDEDADGNKVQTKEFKEGMNKFVNSLGTIYDSEYSDKDLSKLSTLGIAVDFYKRVNENNLGVTPETLSEGVAKIVSRKRRDIYPDKLQEQLLDYIYNEDKENGDGGNQENNTKQNIQKKGNPINDLTFQEQNFVDLDEVNRPSGYNKEYEAEQIARRIGERKREDEKARERQKRENINAELRRRRDEETATSLNDEFEKYFGI